MIDQLKIHVQSIFMPYQNVKAARDLEELLQNLTDKFNDYKQQGYGDEEAYKSTVDSIGDVAELIESIDLEYNKSSGILKSVEPGAFRWFSNGIMAATIYAMLFIVLMLAFKGTITRDGITLPSVALFAIISFVQYLVKGNSKHPRWLVLGSFFVSIVAAGVMTTILH